MANIFANDQQFRFFFSPQIVAYLDTYQDSSNLKMSFAGLEHTLSIHILKIYLT